LAGMSVSTAARGGYNKRVHKYEALNLTNKVIYFIQFILLVLWRYLGGKRS
jgi:hypothetical protein